MAVDEQRFVGCGGFDGFGELGKMFRVLRRTAGGQKAVLQSVFGSGFEKGLALRLGTGQPDLYAVITRGFCPGAKFVISALEPPIGGQNDDFEGCWDRKTGFVGRHGLHVL